MHKSSSISGSAAVKALLFSSIALSASAYSLSHQAPHFALAQERIMDDDAAAEAETEAGGLENAEDAGSTSVRSPLTDAQINDIITSVATSDSTDTTTSSVLEQNGSTCAGGSYPTRGGYKGQPRRSADTGRYRKPPAYKQERGYERKPATDDKYGKRDPYGRQNERQADRYGPRKAADNDYDKRDRYDEDPYKVPTAKKYEVDTYTETDTYRKVRERPQKGGKYGSAYQQDDYGQPDKYEDLYKDVENGKYGKYDDDEDDDYNNLYDKKQRKPTSKYGGYEDDYKTKDKINPYEKKRSSSKYGGNRYEDKYDDKYGDDDEDHYNDEEDKYGATTYDKYDGYSTNDKYGQQDRYNAKSDKYGANPYADRYEAKKIDISRLGATPYDNEIILDADDEDLLKDIYAGYGYEPTDKYQDKRTKERYFDKYGAGKLNKYGKAYDNDKYDSYEDPYTKPAKYQQQDIYGYGADNTYGDSYDDNQYNNQYRQISKKRGLGRYGDYERETSNYGAYEDNYRQKPYERAYGRKTRTYGYGDNRRKGQTDNRYKLPSKYGDYFAKSVQQNPFTFCLQPHNKCPVCGLLPGLCSCYDGAPQCWRCEPVDYLY